MAAGVLMKVPSTNDRFVCVRAWLTDETFGYDHWRAAQFLAPNQAQPALLILCESEAEQKEAVTFLEERAARTA